MHCAERTADWTLAWSWLEAAAMQVAAAFANANACAEAAGIDPKPSMRSASICMPACCASASVAATTRWEQEHQCAKLILHALSPYTCCSQALLGNKAWLSL